MIDINSIIDTFSTEEQSKFISFLNQKNKRRDTKNVALFKLLKSGETEAKTICQKLYKSDNRNAYHALRNRLLHSLIDYTANKNLENENSIDMQIIKYLLASRTFLIQKKYSIAFKILDKAEHLAEEHLLYPILNEIYHTKIQYTSEYPRVNLESLIQKQRENQKKNKLEDELNIVYAKLKHTLNHINYNAEIIDFENILKQSLKNSDIKLNESLSFKSLYQILQIANISAFVTSRYYEIEDFVLKSYSILKAKKESNKQLYYQIQIVYIIGNTLFRNRKFDISMNFMKEMEELMLLNKKQYNKTFLLKKNLVEALNLNYSSHPEKAIQKIEKALSKKHNDIEAELDLKLCLIMFYFQQNNIKQARSNLASLYHTDKWYKEKVGIDWTIKKSVIELIIYTELQEDDLFFSRLKSFRKSYNNYLRERHHARILSFLKFIERLYKSPNLVLNIEFKKEIETTLTKSNITYEDIFDISFYAWLKSKIENTSLYETTLNLVKNS